METINKISDMEIEIITEMKRKITKENLLLQKARIDRMLAVFN